LTDSASYRAELDQAVESIKTAANSVGIRGDGAAQFVYAASSRRILELSRASAGFYVEFWLASDDASSHDQTYATLAEAIQAAQAWLSEA
jgi:hypothetical protein